MSGHQLALEWFGAAAWESRGGGCAALKNAPRKGGGGALLRIPKRRTTLHKRIGWGRRVVWLADLGYAPGKEGRGPGGGVLFRNLHYPMVQRRCYQASV